MWLQLPVHAIIVSHCLPLESESSTPPPSSSSFLVGGVSTAPWMCPMGCAFAAASAARLHCFLSTILLGCYIYDGCDAVRQVQSGVSEMSFTPGTLTKACAVWTILRTAKDIEIMMNEVRRDARSVSEGGRMGTR